MEHRNVGIAIDPAILSRARLPEPREELMCHDLNEGVPVTTDSVDWILALKIMEHLENPTHFLSEWSAREVY